MKNTTMNTEDHISPEVNASLDEFMDETSSFDTSDSTSGIPHAASLEALLSVLKDAKTLVHSIQSRQESTEQATEIISRLANVELEVADLKSKIVELMKKS